MNTVARLILGPTKRRREEHKNSGTELAGSHVLVVWGFRDTQKKKTRCAAGVTWVMKEEPAAQCQFSGAPCKKEEGLTGCMDSGCRGKGKTLLSNRSIKSSRIRRKGGDMGSPSCLLVSS